MSRSPHLSMSTIFALNFFLPYHGGMPDEITGQWMFLIVYTVLQPVRPAFSPSYPTSPVTSSKRWRSERASVALKFEHQNTNKPPSIRLRIPPHDGTQNRCQDHIVRRTVLRLINSASLKENFHSSMYLVSHAFVQVCCIGCKRGVAAGCHDFCLCAFSPIKEPS